MILPSGGKSPIYEITDSVRGWYDTGVKLFDTPKSFTIYCEATFNNYNWTGNAVSTFKSIFGVNANVAFYVGRTYGEEYTNNSAGSYSGRYTALVMTGTTDAVSIPSGVKMSSLYGRANSTARRKFAVTYDHTTRTVTGFSESWLPPSSTKWWTLGSDLITDLPLLLNFRGADSTVNVFEVYDYCMSGEEVANRWASQ